MDDDMKKARERLALGVAIEGTQIVPVCWPFRDEEEPYSPDRELAQEAVARLMSWILADPTPESVVKRIYTLGMTYFPSLTERFTQLDVAKLSGCTPQAIHKRIQTLKRAKQLRCPKPTSTPQRSKKTQWVQTEFGFEEEVQ